VFAGICLNVGIKTVLLALGFVEALFPRQVVDFWMRVAAEESDVTLKPWVYTVARIEGVCIVLWLLWSRTDDSE